MKNCLRLIVIRFYARLYVEYFSKVLKFSDNNWTCFNVFVQNLIGAFNYDIFIVYTESNFKQSEPWIRHADVEFVRRVLQKTSTRTDASFVRDPRASLGSFTVTLKSNLLIVLKYRSTIDRQFKVK